MHYTYFKNDRQSFKMGAFPDRGQEFWFSTAEASVLKSAPRKCGLWAPPAGRGGTQKFRALSSEPGVLGGICSTSCSPEIPGSSSCPSRTKVHTSSETVTWLRGKEGGP